MFNFTNLITLAVVREHGSFTRAAEVLGITQPSVSQQIRELERVAGLPLVQNRGRSIVLTPLGVELADIGARLSVERERAVRLAADHRAGIAGRLIVGASMTTSAYVVPKALALLRKGRPDVTTDLRVGNTHGVADMVSNDVVDIGVIEGFVDRPELSVTPFAKDRLVCIVPPDDALLDSEHSASALQGTTLLVREDGSGTRSAVVGALESRGFVFSRIAEFGSNEAIKEGVINKLGIAWVPEISVRSELAAGTLRKVEFADSAIEREFSVVRRRDQDTTPLGKEFIAILQRLYE